MCKVWRCLDKLGIAVQAAWQKELGPQFAPFRRQFLTTCGHADSFPCPRECGCAHEIVPKGKDRFVAVCQCDPWSCEDIPLAAAEIVLLQVNWSRLSWALCNAFDFDVKAADLGISGVSQIGTHSDNAAPVVLSAVRERQNFRQAVGELVARLRQPFILLAPTDRPMDGRSQELLNGIGARFCALEALVELAPAGGFKLNKAPHDLFADLGRAGAPASSTRGANPRYLLRKEARGGWELVLDGKPTTLPAWKGLDYVAHLLVKAPGEWIHGRDLGAHAGGHALMEGQRNLAADDTESLQGKREAKQEWQLILDDPDSNDTDRNEAEAELAKIEAWALKHLRGTEAGEQRQVRAIRQAIRRVLESLEESRDEVWQAFGAHLDKHLWTPSGRSRGGRNARVRAGAAGRFIYEPPNGVKWAAVRTAYFTPHVSDIGCGAASK
jgi:hypothetical protein